MRARHVAPRLVASLVLAVALTACGGDDDPAPAASESTSGSSTAPAEQEPVGGDVTITGVMHGDVDGATSANCVYVDDAELGRVYLNPVGDFDGFFSTVTDDSNPEHLTELVDADGTVVIAKGSTVSIDGTTDFSQMRCTQGDETEIAITSIAAG